MGWLREVRCYLEIHRAIPKVPEVVELTDTLLSINVELIESEQEEEYETICDFIRKINGFGDYGSIGTAIK